MTEIKEILEEFKKDLSESNFNKLPIIYRLLKVNEQGLVSRDEIIRQLEEKNNHLYNDLTFTSAELERMKQQIEKMKCCEMCKHKNLNWGFSSICEARDKIKIENPLTCKCDKWEIKEK